MKNLGTQNYLFAEQTKILQNISQSNIRKPAPYPRYKGKDVVFLILNGIFRVFFFTLFRAPKPHRASLQLFLSSANVYEPIRTTEKKNNF